MSCSPGSPVPLRGAPHARPRFVAGRPGPRRSVLFGARARASWSSSACLVSVSKLSWPPRPGGSGPPAGGPLLFLCAWCRNPSAIYNSKQSCIAWSSGKKGGLFCRSAGCRPPGLAAVGPGPGSGSGGRGCAPVLLRAGALCRCSVFVA